MTPIGLSGYYQNVGGVKTSYRTLLMAVDLCSYDVIILTETWLNEDFSNSEFRFNNYSVFRCDRNPLSSSKKEGGGVMVAVHNKFSSYEITMEM